MKDHAQKCVKRQCEFAHKTVDQLHPLSRRSSNKTRRLAISWRSVRNMFSDYVDFPIFCLHWTSRLQWTLNYFARWVTEKRGACDKLSARFSVTYNTRQITYIIEMLITKSVIVNCVYFYDADLAGS